MNPPDAACGHRGTTAARSGGRGAPPACPDRLPFGAAAHRVPSVLHRANACPSHRFADLPPRHGAASAHRVALPMARSAPRCSSLVVGTLRRSRRWPTRSADRTPARRRRSCGRSPSARECAPVPPPQSRSNQTPAVAPAQRRRHARAATPRPGSCQRNPPRRRSIATVPPGHPRRLARRPQRASSSDQRARAPFRSARVATLGQFHARSAKARSSLAGSPTSPTRADALAAGRDGTVVAWLAIDARGRDRGRRHRSGEPEFVDAVQAALPTRDSFPPGPRRAHPFYVDARVRLPDRGATPRRERQPADDVRRRAARRRTAAPPVCEHAVAHAPRSGSAATPSSACGSPARRCRRRASAS